VGAGVSERARSAIHQGKGRQAIELA